MEKEENIATNTLNRLKEMDYESVCIGFLSIDIILEIISYLDIKSIMILMSVSKDFYIICQSNPVWQKILFCNDCEKITKYIYNANRHHFLNSFIFSIYTDLDNFFFVKNNFIGYNYRSLMFDLFELFSILRPPYMCTKICEIIRNNYGPRQIEYSAGSIHSFNLHEKYEYDIQLIQKHRICKLFINFFLDNDTVYVNKIIDLHTIPQNVIRRKGVMFYPENVKSLFFVKMA